MLDGGAEEAAAFAASDPYQQARLFESVEVRPWKCVIDRRAP